jgi:hypothetical protein
MWCLPCLPFIFSPLTAVVLDADLAGLSCEKAAGAARTAAQTAAIINFFMI